MAPDSRYVFVSSPNHLNELDNAPDSVLSLNSATKQMLQPWYTMHGFNWFDERGTEGVGFVRVLRTLLTNNLPNILPDLGPVVRGRLSRIMDQQPTQNKTVQLAVYPAILKLVSIGSEKRGLFSLSSRTRRANINLRRDSKAGPQGCSTTITFALHDLCLHPEYAQPLRRELSEHYVQFEQTGVGLPLLDSFIKESARLTPIEAQSTRRGVLQPFTFSDGTRLGIGDWACTPARAIMQKAEYYPDPTSFHGFRFADAATMHKAAIPLSFPSQNPTQLTDVGDTWHVWGTGRMTCPGRFYATAVMKVIISQIIMQYECKLIDEASPRLFTWRSTTIPKNNTMMAFKHV
ncbi:hypothetical protein O1611_g504 [Lasiodiplodia mahajangana]|uniref:Uncharacterized protein n=1 Tax=Lasiodiplodia mahajangana TaxID=1108764 RepID=A0ACC2K005_9PEZI|nr:hypothetical protein O1611_g504 [Lasiodiplodia mahajangana]